MGISHQVRADAGGNKILSQVDQVVRPGMRCQYVGEPEPFADVFRLLRRSCRTAQSPAVGAQFLKRRPTSPRHANSLCAVDQAFPPASRGIVLRPTVVMGIYQQIHIWNYLVAPGTAKASASNQSLI